MLVIRRPQHSRCAGLLEGLKSSSDARGAEPRPLQVRGRLFHTARDFSDFSLLLGSVVQGCRSVDEDVDPETLFLEIELDHVEDRGNSARLQLGVGARNFIAEVGNLPGKTVVIPGCGLHWNQGDVVFLRNPPDESCRAELIIFAEPANLDFH